MFLHYSPENMEGKICIIVIKIKSMPNLNGPKTGFVYFIKDFFPFYFGVKHDPDTLDRFCEIRPQRTSVQPVLNLRLLF